MFSVLVLGSGFELRKAYGIKNKLYIQCEYIEKVKIEFSDLFIEY
jgi:hypothetical protein